MFDHVFIFPLQGNTLILSALSCVFLPPFSTSSNEAMEVDGAGDAGNMEVEADTTPEGPA